MYITTDEVTTHLIVETIEAISDGDSTMLQAAIDAAYVEVKSYLSAFDVASEFSKTGADRNALLIVFVKDVAVWHFINICNVNTDLKLRAKRYDDAKSWLIAVQKGNVTPDLAKSPSTDTTSTQQITFSSNPKRGQHF